MAKSMQMTEELDDCFVKTAANIMRYYGRISLRLGALRILRIYLSHSCIFFLDILEFSFSSFARHSENFYSDIY
jgi:hypothetical protein